jgi:5-formyltetrahydrofolate cyclo-ligase
LSSVPDPSLLASRPPLRRRLLAERAEFSGRPEALHAQASLAQHLQALVLQLEPTCLGVYWPVRSEFNAQVALAADPACASLPKALPFVQKLPPRMHYRGWDGKAPAVVDEARIPASDGAEVTPDVVLVPCVGFTASGYRLGYGGGYFDRWMAAHPQVTTIGIAWAFSEVTGADFEPQPHDRLLTLVLTERGIVEST